MCLKLYTVKHLVEIIPLRFPNGEPPSGEEFDPAACVINHRGEFIYHPEIKAEKKILEPENPLVVSEEDAVKEAR